MMERSGIPRVAPLRIQKNRSRSRATATTSTANSSRTSSLKSRRTTQSRAEQITPPLTPSTSTEDLTPTYASFHSQFHHYLRAFYPFHPPCDDDSSTVTLPLNQGDLVLVHSVQENGWADGTLLASGTRGWLPTNYCEPYHPEPMQQLMRALTIFYELIMGCHESDSLFPLYNQDYMAGLISGVRSLYESTDCLNRDSKMLSLETGNAGVRRHRKAALSELAALIKVAKSLENLLREGSATGPLIDEYLEALSSRAFVLVLRAARFHDNWAEALEEGILEDEDVVVLPPLTPPADQTVFHVGDRDNLSHQPGQAAPCVTPHNDTGVREQSWQEGTLEQTTTTQQTSHSTSHSRTWSQASEAGRQSILPLSMQTRRQSATHRLTWKPLSAIDSNTRLASERLLLFHQDFLSLLQYFVGVNFYSQTSNEILLATSKTVHTGKALMGVVDGVWDRGNCQSGQLARARDNMYSKISELVLAAQNIFRPSEQADDEAYNPESMRMLAEAATSCVRVAGECLESTRYTLERIGDFEFESPERSPTTMTARTDTQPTVSSDVAIAPLSDNSTENDVDAPAARTDVTDGDTAMSTESTSAEISSTTSATASKIARTEKELPPRIDTAFASPMSIVFEESATSPSNAGSITHLRPVSLTESATPSTAQTDRSPASFTSTFTCDSTFSEPQSAATRVDSVGFRSVTSCDTLSSSVRNSERSALSVTSTRASTPEVFGSKLHPIGLIHNHSQSTLDEVSEEGEASMFEHTYAHELIFNKDGQITGGTLPALVERMTTHDSTPDALFVSTFYLTFRLFSTPVTFTQALIDRFMHVDTDPVKLRVFNVFKGWMESHWRMDCDNVALEHIRTFATERLTPALPQAGKRLLELAAMVATASSPLVPRLISSIGKTNTSSSNYVAPDQPVPTPILSKTQANLLKTWKNGGGVPSITDFDPLEIARQLTLKEINIFCSILPEELLACEWTKRSGSLAVNVRAMSTLSTDLTNLVSDTILVHEDPSKRAKVVKHWIKIGARCEELNNYDSLMAIVCSLECTTISRLRRTWDYVSTKHKASFDHLKSIMDISRNYAGLRQRLSETVSPCLPFVGFYLTDLTFVDAGNQATRQLPGTGLDESTSVINFDKHVKTARIISDLQRFQVSYRLQELPEFQTWIQDQFVRVRSEESGECHPHRLYKRSCALEPRELNNSAAQSLTSAIPFPAFVDSKTPKDKQIEFLGMKFKTSS